MEFGLITYTHTHTLLTVYSCYRKVGWRVEVGSWYIPLCFPGQLSVSFWFKSSFVLHKLPHWETNSVYSFRISSSFLVGKLFIRVIVLVIAHYIRWILGRHVLLKADSPIIIAHLRQGYRTEDAFKIKYLSPLEDSRPHIIVQTTDLLWCHRRHFTCLSSTYDLESFIVISSLVAGVEARWRIVTWWMWDSYCHTMKECE